MAELVEVGEEWVVFVEVLAEAEAGIQDDSVARMPAAVAASRRWASSVRTRGRTWLAREVGGWASPAGGLGCASGWLHS